MSLGLLYISGRGVPRDIPQGIVLLRTAAEAHNERAQYNLGWAYESGTGVPRDKAQAIAWYRKAAQAGEPQARARLHGLGVGEGFWGTLFRHVGLNSWQLQV